MFLVSDDRERNIDSDHVYRKNFKRFYESNRYIKHGQISQSFTKFHLYQMSYIRATRDLYIT